MSIYMPIICDVCDASSSETCKCEKIKYVLHEEQCKQVEKCFKCGCTLSNEMYFHNLKAYCKNCKIN